jgi:transcription initiation factor TFIIB
LVGVSREVTGIGRWTSGSHDDFRTACPECGDRLVRDSERGEQVCHNCGYVDSASPDAGPEWKAMALEEKNRRVRVGSPTTLTLHDHGLTTEIGSTMRDSHGKSLDASIRPTVQRMRKLQTWARIVSSEERSLSVVLSKIRELCRTLDLPDIVMETAAQTYRATVKTKAAKGKSIIGMASASVYLACRKCGVPRTNKEVARAAGLEKGEVARYFKLVVSEVEKESVPPTSVEKHVSKLVNYAMLDPKIERLALNLSRSTSGSISSGKVPAGLAAAYVYMSSVMVGKRIPQEEAAELAEVTESTIRNRCRDILDNFKVIQRFEPAN